MLPSSLDCFRICDQPFYTSTYVDIHSHVTNLDLACTPRIERYVYHSKWLPQFLIWELLVKTDLEGHAIYTVIATIMTYTAAPAHLSKNATRNRNMKFSWASYRVGDGMDHNNGQKKGQKLMLRNELVAFSLLGQVIHNSILVKTCLYCILPIIQVIMQIIIDTNTQSIHRLYTRIELKH